MACAVDACESVIDQAVDGGADLLLVHHGLFWNGSRPVAGASFRKLKRAMAGGMAIYSSHLPLDIHPQLGNNIGLDEPVPYFPWKGIFLGLLGRVDCCRENLATLLESAVEMGDSLMGPHPPQTANCRSIYARSICPHVFVPFVLFVRPFLRNMANLHSHVSFFASEWSLHLQ